MKKIGIRHIFTYVFLLISVRMIGAGWTPTDAGLVVNFEPGDQFLLSVMIDDDNNPSTPDVEYFVTDYSSYSGGKFKYEAKNHLKLIPQTAGATEPSAASIWTVDTALTRVSGKVNYALGGISYTMWSSSHQTLVTSDGSFKFLGALSSKENDANLCDVVFVVPTNQSTDVDPNHTLGHAGAFDGGMGNDGFLGMTYREVYMFDIPRSNGPIAYTNASLVTFNRTLSNISWTMGTIKPGMAAYAFADTKHNATKRTLFRLYVLNEKAFSYCTSYFFGWDVQDYKKYRQSNTLTDSTSARKVYALDHFECMERVAADKPYYQTAGMKIPSSDSTYYYVGYNNDYRDGSGKSEPLGSSTAKSQFTKISNLRVRQLKDKGDFRPSKDAYGYMAVDTTLSEDNLGVSFEPAGYFFRTSSGVNVEMKQIDDSTWITDQMWTIKDAYMDLQGEVLLYTGERFSASDPGATISGWSKMMDAKDIPVFGQPGKTAKGKSGWARIHTNRSTKNGGIEFVTADSSMCIMYDYNGLIGIAIPNGYPAAGKNKIKVENARLKDGFTFTGWSTSPEGAIEYWPVGTEGETKFVGDSIEFDKADTITLYAQGTFNAPYRVAFSFIHPTDKKRYFITHPNSSAPRFARARTFTDWTNVYQGMSDAENSEPNYVSTYKVIDQSVCTKCEETEVVLDPQHETVRGVVDSLTFYENWAPSSDEFLGLYYDDPNTLIANNTWAGAFKSSKGWPSYREPAIDNTKISSEHYFTGMKTKTYAVNNRAREDYLKYNEEDNQFDGETDVDKATAFQITGIAVADAHYVILPDTTDMDRTWRDEITFGYHKNSTLEEQAWSKLIGKQLMAVLRVGDDTVYFHPNRNKIMTTASAIRLSPDFRLKQEFELIHDSRAAGLIGVGDSVTIEATDDAFSCNLYSGASSPIHERLTSDIEDTLRVWLRPSGTSKIKNYYGRWKDEAVDSILPDGSRYRDIIIKTKAYHYGATQTQLVLEPKQKTYSFSALAGKDQTIEFNLLRVTSRALLDAGNNEVSKEITATDTIKSGLNLSSATTTFIGSDFSVNTKSGYEVTVRTAADNSTGSAKTDTLTVTVASITVEGVDYSSITAKVPLVQSSLQGTELVWSVVHEGTRYFIMAGSDKLIFRQFSSRDNILYKQGSTTVLKKGAKDDANSDAQYITPWTFAVPAEAEQSNPLTLKAESPVDKYFALSGTNGTTGASPKIVSYEIVDSYANENANYEEIVKLKVDGTYWLKFDGTDIKTTDKEAEASEFSWGYLLQEYNLLNNGQYPSGEQVEFGIHSGAASIKTAYKAYCEYSMLLDNTMTYLCREEQTDSATLAASPWSTSYAVNLINDSRFKKSELVVDSAKLTVRANKFTTTITPSADTIIGTMVGGKYVDIVDTLRVSLGTTRTDYRFKDWKGVESVSDACLKIPLVRKTYHEATYDSLVCVMDKDQYNFSFPSKLITSGVNENDTMKFNFTTIRRRGTNVLDVDNNLITSTISETDTLKAGTAYDLNSTALAEIRLVDDYGNDPEWCTIRAKGDSTVTIQCLQDGIRAPRTAHLYFAYIVTYTNEKSETVTKYVNFKFTVSQASQFEYTNNQILVHMPGASGDPLSSDGRQQVHENKRILYYYNPAPYDEWDQSEELPVRERGFYGWWRWYQENAGVEDTDIPDSVWVTAPRNVGKYNYPFRIIGDSVEEGGKKKFATMGRYTVFHYPSKEYNNKKDPPAKNPTVLGPWNKDTVTYVVDLGNYYDNLPLSMKHINQVDTAVLDTMTRIIEPTLSVREIFELHPWTEMAEKMNDYKTAIPNKATPNDGYPLASERYMEDHEVMAPIGNRLLLQTEQRYNYKNIAAKGHSESLLGYYMRDDNWGLWSSYPVRQDTMIWLGGWDAECEWFTYNPSTETYAKCNHSITVDDDFLNVPAKASITAGKDADTVYYCLRARSKKTTGTAPGFTDDATVDGDYWFNICRYKVIYHDPRRFGPFEETNGKALITNDEIESNYEVLERLNFDYVKPGKDYHIYPHPLPWADASYGYCYPLSPEIPTNRYHDEKDFPGPGEYSLINRIPYSTYWRKMEQHGGAENGYMIYCDGMSSAGQVAALTLSTQLCAGQKMYFSGYVGNVSSQSGKSNPSFTFTVQGSADGGRTWEDITSYMTGDILPSDNWNQILFPINQSGSYDQFRVRIYNVSSDFDGNDFIIDDMCIFATKSPLIAYQAATECSDRVANDSIKNVVVRVDYQGIVDSTAYNNKDVYYTVERTIDATRSAFVPMLDGYFNPKEIKGADKSKPDTIYGHIPMPAHSYVPVDSIFDNLKQLVDSFDATYSRWKEDDKLPLFRKGYVYESLDGVSRPVLYVVHKAKLTVDNTYYMHMSGDEKDLLNQDCAMTSHLNVSNQMMFELDGVEQKMNELDSLCANMTYELGIRVKGMLFKEDAAPIEQNGSCANDWLLYGDTTDAKSLERYKYKYSDIKIVIKDILRSESAENENLNAKNLASVKRSVMEEIQESISATHPLSDGLKAYDVLADLVNKGFLTLYRSNITVSAASGDSVQYMVFPITGTGYDSEHKEEMSVCPTPMFVKFPTLSGKAVPMMVGGIRRDATQANLPVVVLVNAATANEQITLHIDSLVSDRALYSVSLISTDDPDFYEGAHLLNLEPDKIYNFGQDLANYYKKGSDILLHPATSNNYQMRAGYNYTFGITMQTLTGSLSDENGCPIGVVPFTVSVVPDYLRWAPKSADNNKWNNPENWIGVDEHNEILHSNAHFAPLASTDVIIPKMTDGLPYPELPGSIDPADTVRQVGFVYNVCDDIRFLPGAAIGQQQRLTCDMAVVDMSIPDTTWALRSAPVTGMISGDIFMSNADLTDASSLWMASEFDANGRSYKTGNASFWLSVYSRATERVNSNAANDTRSAAAEWSKVTNGMDLSLPAAQGWAVYTRTASKTDAAVRLPKNDDRYYYYDKYGEKLYDLYVDHLRDTRNTHAGGAGKAGKLAFLPGEKADHENYTLTNEVASTTFVFGNPTMGYIDIWGFIADNSLSEEFGYLDAEGHYTTVTAESKGGNVITNPKRYLPPMHAIIVSVSGEAVTTKGIVLNTSRIVTGAVGGGAGAPRRRAKASAKERAIMTVTAVNPVSERCVSRLLLGQGYNDAILSGEDAVLTTLNIDNFSLTSTPTTPFNIYAMEGEYGLSIDLRDSLVNVPLSFYNSALPYDPVTQLWFSGVNDIDGQLVLYDEFTDTERTIIDGICLTIETPEVSHERRYYIRRKGFTSDNSGNVATGVNTTDISDKAQKIIRDGQVLILRDGHVFTIVGQKIR